MLCSRPNVRLAHLLDEQMAEPRALASPASPVTPLEQLAVLATGFGAGIMTSTVGVASLLSFPVLVAVGLPPVVANASNTVGMTPAGSERVRSATARSCAEHPGSPRP